MPLKSAMTPDYSKLYGEPWLLYHRVDLHNELKRTATEPRPHTSNIASIELSAEVSDIDLDGHITFCDGRREKKDVIVVADGIRVRSPLQIRLSKVILLTILRKSDQICDQGCGYRKESQGDAHWHRVLSFRDSDGKASTRFSHQSPVSRRAFCATYSSSRPQPTGLVSVPGVRNQPSNTILFGCSRS